MHELIQHCIELGNRYRPDANPGNEEAARRFKEIEDAFEHLGTAEARAEYDHLLTLGESTKVAGAAHQSQSFRSTSGRTTTEATNRYPSQRLVPGLAKFLGGSVALGASKVLGWTLLFPIILSWVWYLLIGGLDERYRLAGRNLGGFSPTDSASSTFRLAAAVQLGPLSYGLLGTIFIQFGASHDIRYDALGYAYVFIEFAIYLALIIAFCLRPSLWSILLVGAYHFICLLLFLHTPTDGLLSGFAPRAAESFEGGLSVSVMFHALALCLLGWYGFQRDRLGDESAAVWRRWPTSGIIALLSLYATMIWGLAVVVIPSLPAGSQRLAAQPAGREGWAAIGIPVPADQAINPFEQFDHPSTATEHSGTATPGSSASIREPWDAPQSPDATQVQAAGPFDDLIPNPPATPDASTTTRDDDPPAPRSAINTQTGEVYPGVAGGIVNPRNGQFYPQVAGGYIDPATGQFIPAQ